MFFRFVGIVGSRDVSQRHFHSRAVKANNLFLLKVVHGFRQNVSVPCHALLFGEGVIVSIPDIHSLSEFVSVSGSLKLVSSQVSSTSTCCTRANIYRPQTSPV